MDRFIFWRAAIVLAAPFAAFSIGAQSSIYRCEAEGVTMFSDRPCGEEARTYAPDTTRVSTYDAPPRPARSVEAARPKKSAPRASIAADQAKHAAECARMRASLRDIRSKMRAGYSAREGERLRIREKKLKERSRAERCR